MQLLSRVGFADRANALLFSGQKRRAVSADDCCRAWGGRCPRTIAAALGRDDFESRSDSKSVLVRGGSLYPIYRKSSRTATRFAMFGHFKNAAGGARRRLLPRLVGTILNREAIQKLCFFVLRMQKRSHFVARSLYVFRLTSNKAQPMLQHRAQAVTTTAQRASNWEQSLALN